MIRGMMKLSYTINNMFSDMPAKSKDVVAEFFGDIFVEAYNCHYDMNDFTHNFMKSEFCKKYMDGIYSTWQYQNAKVSMEVIEHEIHPIKSDNSYTSKDNCYWVGYLYKQIHFETEIPSNEIVDLYSFNKLSNYLYSHEDYNIEDMVTDLTKTMELEKEQECDKELLNF